MRNHTIEFGDRTGKSFKMHIATPSNWGMVREIYTGDVKEYRYRMTGSETGKSQYGRVIGGNWRAIDKGFIRYNSGKILGASSGVREGDLTTSDLYLINLDQTWGMKLFEYEDFWGVNDSGEGFVIQSWGVSFADGKFSWSLAD